MADLPFVGSDVLGSAVCMDKDISKRLLRDAGLAIAPFITLTRSSRHQISFAEVQAKLGLPLFVKPANQGSSVGVSKVNSEEQYQQAVALAFDTTEKQIITILRAVHKYKDSREHFEMRTHKRLIDIVDPTPKAVDSLMHIDLPADVNIEIKL
mgnify:CR=1 FL=1